jgi:hypothetical protein
MVPMPGERIRAVLVLSAIAIAIERRRDVD